MSVIRIGKYTVLGQLGTGAHSTILQISRQEDGRQYALKVVPIDGPEDKKYQEQAEHEFRVAQMLEHPNLIKIHTLDTQTDWLFRVKKVLLLIEFVPGSTLDKVKSFSVKKLLPIFVQIASGLVHMHRRGVYHADLKPGNILYNARSGQAKIIDYGLAWIKGEGKGRIQGTPEYMAPETVRGVVNEKTDIYNFGATMYRMVTFLHVPSVVPHQGTERIGAKQHAQLIKQVAECNSSAPKELCEVIHQCLDYSPERRPERMSVIQGILDRLADEVGPANDEE